MPLDEERERKTKAYLVDKAKRAIALRSKDRDFHGLDREFMYHQAEMLLDFEKSKDVHHPRDVGDVREQILRRFLRESGFVPCRYAVSETSIRVASTSGHLSNEIDIAIFDPDEAVRLMKREDSYEVLPVENVYGVIQVKSRLNKKEIRNGLDNIASFKRLHRPRSPMPKPPETEEGGFGLLFAYDTDTEWTDIAREIEAWGRDKPKSLWCNAVFILSKGFFLFGGDQGASPLNSWMDRQGQLTVYGNPDRQNDCLLSFYRVLMLLLRHTKTVQPVVTSYFTLPLVAGARSYQFRFDAHAEYNECPEHGDYQRALEEDALEKIVTWCRNAQAFDQRLSFELASGNEVDEKSMRVPQDLGVRIYNPDGLPLKDVVVQPRTVNGMTFLSLAFDWLDVDGLSIWLPFVYSAKDRLIQRCPACAKQAKKTRAKTGRAR